MTSELTLEKFEEAAERVKEVTLETRLVYSEYFSSQTGNKVYFKPENLQYTGAYKVRGAYYKISTLSEEERNKGLITASAGNHAQGVAYAAKIYGAKAVIVMPTSTPIIKINRTKSYGAEVVLYGDVYDEDYCINADEEWIREAFINIIQNSSELCDKVKVKAVCRDDRCIVNIKDNGSGFEEDRIPYIFDRFETTGSAAAGHAGIGLNLSRLIIEAHHGTVDVRNNEDGKGAVMAILCCLIM